MVKSCFPGGEKMFFSKFLSSQIFFPKLKMLGITQPGLSFGQDEVIENKFTEFLVKHSKTLIRYFLLKNAINTPKMSLLIKVSFIYTQRKVLGMEI